MDITVNDMWSYAPDPACLQMAGTNENNSIQQELIVFPNPADKLVYVQQSRDLRYSHIELMNIHGQIVHRQNAELLTELNLQNTIPGIYFLMLSNSIEKRYLKLIVQ